MRKFSTFAGMMPHDLIEARARIYSSDGKHCPGDNMAACRFGFAISWCDGSGQAQFTDEETLDAAIEAAKKYLQQKGWHLGEIEYTGKELTADIIEKHTTKMKSKSDAVKEYSRFLRLKMECLEQPWFDAVRSEINGSISVANISDLPDAIRNHEYGSELISFYNDKLVVKLGYTMDDDYVRGGQWVEIGEAKERLGMDAECPDIGVVNRIVADLLDAYEHRTDKARERKAKYLESFFKLTGLFGKAIEDCAGNPRHAPASLAALEAYLNMDWSKGIRDRDGIFEIVRKVERGVCIDAINQLSINRPYFDWSTLSIKTEGELTLGKVKLSREIYEDTRKTVKDMFPDEVARVTEARRTQGYRCSDDWRNVELDVQWWHFAYGINGNGDAVLSSVFGPESMGIAN